MLEIMTLLFFETLFHLLSKRVNVIITLSIKNICYLKINYYVSKTDIILVIHHRGVKNDTE